MRYSLNLNKRSWRLDSAKGIYVLAGRDATLSEGGGASAGTGIADQGTIWYVSTSGSGVSTNIGSPGALSTTLASGSIQAGDTIKLRGGTYTGTFTASISGTVGTGIDNPDSKIIVKPYADERPILDPGTATDTRILEIRGSYIWFCGIEARISNYTGRSPSGSEATAGFSNYNGSSDGVKTIGCTVHDITSNCINFFSGDTAGGNYWRNSEVHGCVLYFAGETPQAGPNYAYPIYTQNASGYKKYYKNAIWCGFGNYPIHCYGTASMNMIGMDFQYNTTIGGVGGAGAWVLYKPDDSGTGTWSYNNFYTAQGSTDGVLDLGYWPFTGQLEDTICQGNYIRGKWGITTDRTNLTIGGASEDQKNRAYGDLVDFTSGDYPNNHYYSSSPGANWVRVTPYDYIGKAGLVSIFNFTGSTSLAVDLSPILSVGDDYEVIDIQNRFGSAITTGTYAGGTVSLSLTSTSVATPGQVPTGRSAPSHTSSEFNSFLVRATPYTW